MKTASGWRPGEAGELCIRGPQVMAGYWQRPGETAKVMHGDDWLRTGDIAMMNEEGFFKIVDRKKDMIIVSGFNVYPNEIEDVLAAHDKVLEVAAIGVPHDKSGEVVKACVVKKDPGLTEDELRAYCKEHLTGYKCPKYYRVFRRAAQVQRRQDSAQGPACKGSKRPVQLTRPGQRGRV